MEKRTPHRSLSVVKALVEAGKVRSTFSALAGAAALGLRLRWDAGGHSRAKSCGLPQEHDQPCRPSGLAGRLPPSHERGKVYLKLTVMEDVLIVSFKEL
jgi:motility quorum-sensing regulator/GCU-specific mRNA interferase toxin